jgi:exonuclease SbcD
MTRILHTGDTHLGYRQYHRQARREDFLAAFDQVVTDAVADGVDAVVHAGDLFHDRQPALEDIMGAMRVLRRLADADVPFLAIVGNHEAKRDRQWLDLFESMGLATRLGNDPVTVGDVDLYGLDFVPRSRRDTLDYAFEPGNAEYAALVSHGLFAPFEHGDWDARELLAESPVPFDAVLLGDDHDPKTRQVEEPDETWLTYCGSTERTSAAEREERGYNLVAFEDGRGVDIRRRGLPTREFVFVSVDLSESEGTGRVRERIDQYDVEDAVVVVEITGDGGEVLPANVEAFADDRGAFVTRVTDRRDRPEETEIDVSFADPDDAVAERITELGLSSAARDIDETIRASKVADSNVADTVERRVQSLLEEGTDAFEPADDSVAVGEDDSGDGTDNSSSVDDDPADNAVTGDGEGDDAADSEAAEDQVTMGDYQ